MLTEQNKAVTALTSERDALLLKCQYDVRSVVRVWVRVSVRCQVIFMIRYALIINPLLTHFYITFCTYSVVV